jgi:hypothetical protein
MVLQAPKRAKRVPTTGFERPITIASTAAPLEIWVMLQPNSAWNDSMKTGKTYMSPAAPKNRTTESVPTIFQPWNTPLLVW